MTLLAIALALAPYWSVHIDFPVDRVAFEGLDRQFNTAIREFYAANQLEPPPSFTFVTAGGHYYGLRPRASLADFDKPSPPELRTKTAPISEETHKTLREHHSEIWHLDREMTTATELAPRRYAILRSDFVPPPKDGEYNAAMKQLVHDLAGVDVIAFFSTYGNGSYRYLLLSDAPIKVRTLKKLAETRDVVITEIALQ